MPLGEYSASASVRETAESEPTLTSRYLWNKLHTKPLSSNHLGPAINDSWIPKRTSRCGVRDHLDAAFELHAGKRSPHTTNASLRRISTFTNLMFILELTPFCLLNPRVKILVPLTKIKAKKRINSFVNTDELEPTIAGMLQATYMAQENVQGSLVLTSVSVGLSTCGFVMRFSRT